MSDINEALATIQGLMHAPKSSRNDFGKYNYRTAEQIIAAFKDAKADADIPATLIMSDGIAVFGDRVFLEATATFRLGNETIAATGHAMHPMQKKGMDDAQITGSCSSYARKYALCGLFAIDDSRDDPDTRDNREAPAKSDFDQKVDTVIARMGEKETLSDLTASMQKLEEAMPDVASDPRVIAARQQREQQIKEKQQ